MWNAGKIRRQKEYFAQQRKQPTGNFTEFVVRTYYCILQCCGNSNACPASMVRNRKICQAVYYGIYDQPDHDYDGVIDDCKKKLREMGYLHTENRKGEEWLVIDRPLDFLLPGEHETYLKKFPPISSSSPASSVSVSIRPISDSQEGQALLRHMLEPERYPDPGEHPAAQKISQSTALPCRDCDGHYVIRSGCYGIFLGCSHFPKCKSTVSVADAAYALLQRNGIAVYQVTRPCWKCGEPIAVRSYFPQLDLCEREPGFGILENLYVIRLSILPALDEYLSQKYPSIRSCYSKKAGFSYIANTCPHCGSLQGSQMALGEVYEYLKEAAQQRRLSFYVVETIPLSESTLPKAEWEEALHGLL